MSEEKKQVKQYVINVTEQQKDELTELKAEFNLSDKGVMELLLEVAQNNRMGAMPNNDGELEEVDVFALIVRGLNLSKKPKKEKVVLTEEEKEVIRLQKQLTKVANRMKELETTSVTTEEVQEEVQDDVEVLIG